MFAARRNNIQHLYRRELGRFDIVQVEGTEGGYYPEFSPDGQSVAFLTTGGVVKRVPVSGGAPVVLLDAAGTGLSNLSWSGDRLRYSSRGEQREGVWEIPASGGERRSLTTPDASRQEVAHRFPQSLPGGDALLFTAIYSRPPDADGNDDVVVQRLSSGERRVLTKG